MSMRGGGTAGGGRSNKDAPQVAGHIPKFLQQYAHMLGDRGGQRDDDDEEDGGAIRRAKAAAAAAQEAGDTDDEEDGAGAAVFDTEGLTPQLARQALAGREKEEGNRAYAQGRHEEAVGHFSRAIAASPRDHVLFSNRSAAYAGLARHDAALADARKVVVLKPDWAKGYSRVAAALMGLKVYDQAEAAYKKGLQLEPRNAALREGLAMAQEKQRQESEQDARTGRHEFKRKVPGAAAGTTAGEVAIGGDAQEGRKKKAAERPTKLLSFDGGDDA